MNVQRTQLLEELRRVMEDLIELRDEFIEKAADYRTDFTPEDFGLRLAVLEGRALDLREMLALVDRYARAPLVQNVKGISVLHQRIHERYMDSQRAFRPFSLSKENLRLFECRPTREQIGGALADLLQMMLIKRASGYEYLCACAIDLTRQLICVLEQENHR